MISHHLTADRRVKKQQKKLVSAPGEWYRELPQQQKPHRPPEWPDIEMAPSDAQRLAREAEGNERQRAFPPSDRRGPVR